jgi:hypothetical protein
MTERYQIGGLLCSHDTRDPGDTKHISLFVIPLADHLQGIFLQQDTPFRNGDTMCVCLITHIDHMSRTFVIKMA